MRGVRVVPEALRLRVRLDERDEVFVATGQAQIVDRLGVDREDAAGRAVLGRHVRDRRAVGERQMLQAVAEELDELADDAVLAQHLRDGEHEVGRGRAFGQLARELEADDLRNQHRRRLAEHRGLGLDAADAPAEHADAVDHRGVRIGAEHRVGIGPGRAVLVGRHHDAGEVLEVDLMHDAGARRHDLEVVERVLAPAQEAVALVVAVELDLHVEIERVGRAERVDLHRVVDDEFGRDQRVDLLRVAAELDDRVAHRGEIDDAGHAGEVLQHDARRHEGDFRVGFLLRVPVRDRFDLLRGDVAAVFVAQQVLEQDLHRVGQARDVEFLAEFGEARDRIVLAVDFQRIAGGEGIGHVELLAVEILWRG